MFNLIKIFNFQDDTGTLAFIQAAIRDNPGLGLKDTLRLVKDTFLTHKQMGEAEATYRLFPSMHLTDSNLGSIYLHTGFDKSKFLKKIMS